jgi:hypothetical protein
MANPSYSDYLQFSPTFKWGGRSWGQGDDDAFSAYLKKHGINPAQWGRKHPTAAKSFDPVENQVYSLFQPQLTGIDAERKRTADLWNRRMQTLGGFTTALMPYLQQVPGAINAPYQQGAAGVQSSAQGYGGRLNADSAAEASGANAVLNSIGAPEGQQLAGGDAGGVLAGVGGLEADLMRASGGAYATAAAQLPKTASLESQLMMKDLIHGASDADKGFSDQVMEVLQGLPGARQKLVSDQQSQQLARQKFELDALQNEREWYLKRAAFAAAQGDDVRSNQYLKLAQQTAVRLNNASAGLDAWGNPKPVKPPKPSTSSTTPGTPAWKASQLKAVGGAQAHIEADVNKFLTSIGATQAQAGNTNSTLKRQLWEKYKYLGTTPTAKKALRKAIALAVSSWRPKPGAGDFWKGPEATP